MKKIMKAKDSCDVILFFQLDDDFDGDDVISINVTASTENSESDKRNNFANLNFKVKLLPDMQIIGLQKSEEENWNGDVIEVNYIFLIMNKGKTAINKSEIEIFIPLNFEIISSNISIFNSTISYKCNNRSSLSFEKTQNLNEVKISNCMMTSLPQMTTVTLNLQLNLRPLIKKVSKYKNFKFKKKFSFLSQYANFPQILIGIFYTTKLT